MKGRATIEQIVGAAIGLALVLAGLQVLAAVDSNTTITSSSTVNGYKNENLGNGDEYVRPYNRSVYTPIWVNFAFPTAQKTAQPLVTPIPANTPGTANGCLFQNPKSNPDVCLGAAPVCATPGTTTACSGIELYAGQSSYQVAPNGDCGQFKVCIPAVGNNAYQVNLEIEQ